MNQMCGPPGIIGTRRVLHAAQTPRDAAARQEQKSLPQRPGLEHDQAIAPLVVVEVEVDLLRRDRAGRVARDIAQHVGGDLRQQLAHRAVAHPRRGENFIGRRAGRGIEVVAEEHRLGKGEALALREIRG